MAEQDDINQSIKDAEYAATSVKGDAFIYVYNYNYSIKDVEAKSADSEEVANDENLQCPYRGLFNFSPNDSEYFFGRDVFIEELFKAAKNRNFISVLGASGSGKSSVVLAGLVPKLEQEGNWKFTHFRPSSGNDPFYALAEALVPLYRTELDSTDRMTQAGKLAKSLSERELSLAKVFSNIQRKYPNHKVLLIADQFEELYTQYSDLQFRHRFLDCLLASFQSSNSGSSSSTVLVATMRADFLANALSYRPFANMLQNADIKLAAMNREELTEVIEQPAQKLGVTFEVGLVERILNDVKDEPGNLPLLEFALTELWKKRTGKQLTHDAYEAIGQVKGALADYADDKYNDLKLEEKEQARRIFIQLVRPGEGTEDTRRRANRSELREENWNLITRKDGLADSRLVVTSRNDSEQEIVEVVHEALIQNWGQLREWMETDREFRTWQERLRVLVSQWEKVKRNEDGLLRGLPLAEAENWKQKRFLELSQAEQDFIQFSLTLQDREKAERERRELEKLEAQAILETAEKKNQVLAEANQEAKRRILIGSAILAISLVGATIAGVMATQAVQRQQEAQTGARLEQAGVSALRQFEIGQIDSLLSAMHTGQELYDIVKDGRPLDEYPATSPILTLQQILYDIQEQNQYEGHTSTVESISFSPDGEYIATASSDGTARLWRRNGTLVREFKGHRSNVMSVSFSPDGKYLATASSDDTARLWRRDGTLVQEFKGHKSWVNSVSFSPDGQYLATASRDNTARLWRRNGTLVQEFKGHTNAVSSVSFSPDGKYLATGALDNTARLWRRDGTLVQEFKGHNSWVNSVSFSPDGKYLATASGDSIMRLWKLDGTLVEEFKGHTNGVNSVSFSPDGKYLATASEDSIMRLWKLDGTLVEEFKGHTNGVKSVSFSSDGKYLATASEDSTARLWRRHSPIPVQEFKGHEDSVWSVSVSPDGEHLATGSLDGRALLWRRDGTLVKEFIEKSKHRVWSVSFSPDGKYLATAAAHPWVRLWRLDGTLVQEFKGHDWKNAVSFSPNGNYLATASIDGKVRLWHFDGTLLEEFQGYTNGKSISFSPDGKYLATASEDSTARLWRLDGTPVQKFKGHQGGVNSISFSPDGKYLATASEDSTARLWRLDGTPVQEFKGHQGGVNSISFSPDGRQYYLATAADDGTGRLWLRDGTTVQEFRGHIKWVSSVSFSSDGKYLVTGSSDKTARLWLVESLDNLLAQGCNSLKDYLIHHPRDLETLLVCQNQSRLMAAAPFLVTEGEKQAKEGSFDSAVATFRKALEWNPNLDLNPDTEVLDQDPEKVVRHFTALGKVEKGEKLATQGKVEEAMAAYQEAQKLAPYIDLNPKTEVIDKDSKIVARKLAAPAKLREGKKLARQGKVEEAIAAYQKAQKFNQDLEISVHSWNILCWFGSLYGQGGQAAEVMNACEKAVALAPKNGGIRDSRGLARALSGDTAGAIEDFQVFINSPNISEKYKIQRRSWIDALSAGKNPFTDEELESLRNE